MSSNTHAMPDTFPAPAIYTGFTRVDRTMTTPREEGDGGMVFEKEKSSE